MNKYCNKKQRYYIVIRRKFKEENQSEINMYPTQRQINIKKILRNVNGEINSTTIIEGDFDNSLTSMVRTGQIM